MAKLNVCMIRQLATNISKLLFCNFIEILCPIKVGITGQFIIDSYQSINHDTVCRTEPGAQGLLNMLTKDKHVVLIRA